MKWGVEFWLRVAIAAGFAAIIIAAPSVLFPFVVSLIITTLLNPVAHAVYGQTQKMGWTRFPYDFAILFSFALFIAVIYLIGVHIFVPFISEFQEFIKSVPGMLAAVQQAVPELEKQYQLSLMPPEAKSLFARILQDIGEYTLKIASFSLSAIFSFASTVVELIVVPFITFYMMKRGGYFVNAFIHIFPDRFHHHLEELFKEIHFVLNAYIRGQLLLSTLMAVVDPEYSLSSGHRPTGGHCGNGSSHRPYHRRHSAGASWSPPGNHCHASGHLFLYYRAAGGWTFRYAQTYGQHY